MASPNPTPTADGTSQAARLRPELDPAFAALDGRSTADLLAFARAYAAALQYVDDDGRVSGDWQGLFPGLDGLVEAADYLRAPEAFSRSRAAPHARPHFALLLAFVDLLGAARGQLNGLTARHLDFFYRDVLHMVPKAAVPDRLHVLALPERGRARVLLPAGTALAAGKDDAGRARIFRTATDLMASAARVAELRSLRADIRTIGLRQASRQYLSGGSRDQAFMAMMRIALGQPLPGDALPVPVLPGLLPPPPAPGAPAAVVDFDTLLQADRIIGFVGQGLGLPLYDDFRRLLRLWQERQQGDARDWARIHAVLLALGRRRDAGFELPEAPIDDFHLRLRGALGLTPEAYATMYDRLPEVDSLEDAYSLLDREPLVQAFVQDELGLPLDDFKAMMQVKLRIDGQWAEIAALIEAGGRRIDAGRVLTGAQRAQRDVPALLAAAFDRLDWPVPGTLQGLHAAFEALEHYFCMPAEDFHHLMAVALRSRDLPPTQAADSPAEEAAWAPVYDLCTRAHARLQYRLRQEALLRAAAPGRAAGQPARAVADMLALALGEPQSLAAALLRLADLGVAPPDREGLAALAGGTADAPEAEWARVAALLEGAQRNREALVVGPPQRVLWHHVYPAADATALRVPGQADDAPAPRWRAFGSLDAATRRDQPPAPVLGWAIASPLLALGEGSRSVHLVLGLDGDAAAFDADALRRLLMPPDGSGTTVRFNPFLVQFSGAEGWLEPASVQMAFVRPDLGGYPAVPGLDTAPLRALVLHLVLGEQQAAVVPARAALHGLDSAQPLLRLMLRPAWDDQHGRHHTAYQVLARLRLRRWRLAVSVSGLAGLALRNDSGELDPRKPFEPFGAAPASGARLSIGHAELVGKALDEITFRGQWMGAPASLAAHYRNYEPGFKSDSFTVRIGLRDGPVFNAAPQPLPLFGGLDNPGAARLAPPLAPETGRLLDAGTLPADVADWRRCWVWELAGDLQHAAYPARALRKSLDLAALLAAKGTPVADDFIVNPPYTPKLKSLVVDYSASAEQAALPAVPVRNGGGLLHLHPFGHEALLPGTAGPDGLLPEGAWAPGAGMPLLPAHDAEGELYIGLAGVQAPQRLSLLVQAAEGSADPDAPREPVRWAVLSGNRWLPLQEGPLEGSLLADGTRDLVNAGIVELQLPPVAPSTLLPGAAAGTSQAAARYWLRLRRQRAVEGVCDLVALHPHAVLAQREPGDTADDLSRPLPARTVTGLLDPVPGLAGVQQPYSGFGGRAAEAAAHFNTRVSERLRHRQRALTPWDYEHLVLEQFPQLYKAKCLRADAVGDAAGCVDLVVVPDIANRFPFDPFAPKASADLIRDIEAFLADKTPAFARVRVKNPSFVAVKVRCGVRFMPGTDEGYCRARLNDELNRFLSPWAYDGGADLVIGGSLYANSIINFIEQREYVDFIAGLRLFTGEQGRFTLVPEGPGYRVTADRPDTVLVAAASHEFDVIALNDFRVQGFGGIGHLRIELDFSVA